MNDNTITIKSGVDIDSKEFKEYYNLVQEQGKNILFLNDLVERNSSLLTSPTIINRDKMYSYKEDDMAFIWQNGKIIGHRMTMLEKKRPVINLGMKIGNHLDMDEVRDVNSIFRYIRVEFYCKHNYNLDELLRLYLEKRTYGFLEYTGELINEPKINVKKREI